MMKIVKCMSISLMVCAMVMNANATISNFDDVTLSPDSHWSGNYTIDEVGGNYDTVYFSSGSATFENHSDGDWASWAGFAYSNEVDTTTPGYGNQFSVYTGQAHSGSNFGIGYQDTYNGFYPQFSLSSPTQISGVYVTNTTYAALAMLNGQDGATAFDENSWFKLTITGKNALDDATGTVDFYLANGRDIVDEWTWVGLTSLGTVASLELSLTSSDNGMFGMNTPAYFAIDTIPEPMTLVLLGLGSLMLRR